MTAKVKLSSLRADLAKEREGDWIEAPDLGAGVAFLVRSVNLPAFIAARDRATRKLATKYGDETIPPDDLARVNGDLAVEHLLFGWRGLDVEFSPEVASEILTDESYRRVRMSVYGAASKVGRLETEFVSGAAKN